MDFYSGVNVEGVTPLPIPNREVKPLGADGTIWVTVWESRTMPGFYFQSRSEAIWNGTSFCAKRKPRAVDTTRGFFFDATLMMRRADVAGHDPDFVEVNDA